MTSYFAWCFFTKALVNLLQIFPRYSGIGNFPARCESGASLLPVSVLEGGPFVVFFLPHHIARGIFSSLTRE